MSGKHLDILRCSMNDQEICRLTQDLENSACCHTIPNIINRLIRFLEYNTLKANLQISVKKECSPKAFMKHTKVQNIHSVASKQTYTSFFKSSRTKFIYIVLSQCGNEPQQNQHVGTQRAKQQARRKSRFPMALLN